MTAGRVAGLDGLRGVAILMVVLLHVTTPVQALVAVLDMPPTALDLAVVKATSFGWAGVDLFFVLSGFLITGILLVNKDEPGCLRSFFGRRVLRIFPLYYAVVALALVGPALLSPPGGHAERGVGEVASYLLYASNVWQAANPEQRAHDPALGITWSLAIEEQFYLLWPWLVVFLRRRALLAVILAILVMAPLLRGALRLADVHWWAVYVLTPCRLDGLAMGALLAVCRPRGALLPWLLLGGGGLALAAVFVREGAYAYGMEMQTIGYTANAVVAAGALLLAARPGVVARLLRAVPLRLFGRYSYAIYLLHYPIMTGLAAVALRADTAWSLAPLARATGSYLPVLVAFAALSCGVSLLAGVLSWHLLEKHFLALKRWFPARPYVGSGPSGRP